MTSDLLVVPLHKPTRIESQKKLMNLRIGFKIRV